MKSLIIRPLLLPVARWFLRLLQTDTTHVSLLRKVVAAILLVPIFGSLLVALRVRAALFGPLTVQSETRFGSTVATHLPDLIQMYIHLFGIWEPDLTTFIQRRLRPGDGFVDVGANIGYFSLLAAELVQSEQHAAVVTAIDASPSNFAELLANIERSEHGNSINAINKAVASERGTLQIYAGPKHNVGLATTVATRGLSVESTIEAAPLTELLNDEEIANARLVKIDVEGGEPAVLAGMRDFVDRCRDDVELLIELSPEWWADRSLTPQQVLQPFLDSGFHVYAIENNYWPWRYLWPHDVSPPRRVHDELPSDVKRLDIVLSRVDAEEL